MKIKKTALILLTVLIFTAVILTAITAGVLIAQQNVPNRGDLGGSITSTIDIGVYSDPEATINCTTIEWGSLNSGDMATKTVYIKNAGNVSETLSMTAIDWTPSTAIQCIYITWNKEGAILEAGKVVPATITLKIESDTGDLSDFGFNLVISGTA